MQMKGDESFVLTFAESLTSACVEAEMIENSLQFFCVHFGLDFGVLYEIDQYNKLNCKEQSKEVPSSFLASFSLEEICIETRNGIIEQEGVTICNINNDDKISKEVCALFNANALIIYPIRDNTKQLHGMFVFVMNDNNIIDDSDQHLLKILFSMLSNYVAKRMHENKLSFAISSLESILDNTGIDIYVNDFNTHDILYANKSMAAPYGGVEAFNGRKCWEVLFPEQGGPCEFCPQKKIIDNEGNPTKVHTWDYQRAFDGSWFRVFSAAFRWIDGRLAHVVSSADITDNKNYEATIHRMANFDYLTDLPNRRMLLEECEKRISNASTNEKGYVLFFDVDGFKAINDNFGHDAGDEFLVELANFFRSIPMLKDSVYRNGGDEFIALIGGEQISKLNIRDLASFIHTRFLKPWKLKKGDVTCSVSIGVSCYPEDSESTEELLSLADRSMYQAKKSGNNQICFSDKLPN